MIFLLCFNPMVEFLSANATFGYNLNDNHFITAPYADDFCLITGNKRSHQRLVNLIASHTKSLGLKLKPRKCRSLSISRGTPIELHFNLEGSDIQTLYENDFKFLGSLVTFKNTTSDVFQYVTGLITTGIENIDRSLVRDEYKLKIYSEYFLQSIRFHLTVNDMSDTQLKSLDSLTNRYLKKWSGLARPATLAFIHMPQFLNVMSISDLYLQSHALSYAKARFHSDPNVIACLDSALDRESKWTGKKSTIVKCNELWSEVKDSAHSVGSVKTQTKSLLRNETSSEWASHVQSLAVQGTFFELVTLESKSTMWKSIMYNLPYRVAKFLANALSDTLNTNTNLSRWGKMISNKCNRCGNRETLLHVLNACQNALEDGRFTWRHNNLLHYLTGLIEKGVGSSEDVRISVDLADSRYQKKGISTIPIECGATNLCPDICVFREQLKEILIFELSVPFETNVEKMHEYKSRKYCPLVNDIEENGFTVSLIPLEVGSRGRFISAENNTRLRKFLKTVGNPTSFKNARNALSKLAIISSFTIYSAKNDPKWEVSAPLRYSMS